MLVLVYYINYWKDGFNFCGWNAEQGQSKSEVVMVKDGRKDDANSENEISKEDLFQGLNQMAKAPENQEYDVSLSGHTIMKLGRITLMICIISTLVPTVYILRLSPREILNEKRRVIWQVFWNLKICHIRYLDGKSTVSILSQCHFTFEEGKVYAIVKPHRKSKNNCHCLWRGLSKDQIPVKFIMKMKIVQKIGLTNYRKKDVAIVFQSYNLIYYMNAYENV